MRSALETLINGSGYATLTDDQRQAAIKKAIGRTRATVNERFRRDTQRARAQQGRASAANQRLVSVALGKFEGMLKGQPMTRQELEANSPERVAAGRTPDDVRRDPSGGDPARASGAGLMADRGWKSFERRQCRDMGVERQPVTGERHGADNQPHELFAFQFKLRKALPAWLWTWLAGIVATADRDSKIGVLVLKRPRQRDTDALAIVRWGDWVALHGRNTEREQR